LVYIVIISIIMM